MGLVQGPHPHSTDILFI